MLNHDFTRVQDKHQLQLIFSLFKHWNQHQVHIIKKGFRLIITKKRLKSCKLSNFILNYQSFLNITLSVVLVDGNKQKSLKRRNFNDVSCAMCFLCRTSVTGPFVIAFCDSSQKSKSILSPAIIHFPVRSTAQQKNNNQLGPCLLDTEFALLKSTLLRFCLLKKRGLFFVCEGYNFVIFFYGGS